MKPLSFLILPALLILSDAALAQTTEVVRNPVPTSPAVARRLTLEEAKNLAANNGADDPMVKLAQLNAKVSVYKRKQAQADYFPKVAATFTNMHFNKFMGQRLQLINRSFGIPLLNKDFTVFLTTITQPLTPLLKVREGVKIMRADEAIANAKATAAAQSAAAKVEKAYYELVITQRQKIVTNARVDSLEKQLHVASNTPVAITGMAEKATALLEASKRSLELKDRELALSAELNALVGLPVDTSLYLVVPMAPINDSEIALSEAVERGTAYNPAVIEAEQNVVKAKAAKRLSLLEYVPDVAVVGGYSYQNAIPLLPNDFTFVGVMATYNVFDFGKRENLVKERKTTLELAELGLQLAKGAAAAQIKTSYFEVERTRKMLELTRRAVTAQEMMQVSYDPKDPDQMVVRAAADLEVLETELAYRKAYAELRRLIGE